jgi:hypothetical protein
MAREVDLLDPDAYVREGYPWQTWAELRRHDPVSRRVHGEVGDYWALVRHAEIVRSPGGRASSSGPRLAMPAPHERTAGILSRAVPWTAAAGNVRPATATPALCAPRAARRE